MDQLQDMQLRYGDNALPIKQKNLPEAPKIRTNTKKAHELIDLGGYQLIENRLCDLGVDVRGTNLEQST